MSDDVNYVEKWENEATQCKYCQQYQVKDGKTACVPDDKTFEEAITEYGEVSPVGHCNYFTKK